MRFADLIHGDFAAVPVLAEVHARGDRAEQDREGVEPGHAAVCRYVRAFFDSRLKGDDAAEDFPRPPPEENGIDEGVVMDEPRLVSAPR